MAEPRERNFKVSATGGAGTNGQPARYAAGIDNAQDFYDVQTAAPMAGRNPANRPPAVAQEQRPAPRMPLDGIVPLDAPTQYPDEGVDTGGALGSQDVAALASYLPFYAKIAEMPQASNAFRNWYRYVRSQVEGGA